MTSDEIKQYMEKSFDFDCPRMALRQNVESGARMYEGPGTIYQNDEGELLFKLYSTGAPDTKMLERAFGPNSLKAGQVVPRTEYFTLEATSMKGADWRCDVVSPDLNQGVVGGPVATGRLYELSKTTEDANADGGSSYLSLRFGRDFDFPGNAKRTTRTSFNDVERGFSGDWTSAAFQAVGLKFELHKEYGGVFLSAESSAPALPAHLDLRICEALEFSFFQHEPWVMRVIAEGKQYKTTLRPFQKALKRSHFYPLQFRQLSSFDANVWTLFGAYLEFVLKHDKPKWHPLSENIHLAVMADAGQLESRLIELSVVIEGVLGVGFPTIGKPDTKLVAQIDSASKLIQESSLGETMKKRLAGILGTMKSPRAKDRLLVFVNAGIIRHELMNAWHGMRNSAVHAPGLGGAEIQLVYEQYQAALTLLNELVMLLIGYRGAYTDYSVKGWPQREWTGTLANIEGNAVSATEPKANRPQPVAESVDLSALTSQQCPASSEPASPVASQIQQTDPE